MRHSITFCVLLGFLSGAFASPPSGYNLIWSDEFDGPSLDTSTWTMDTCCTAGAEHQSYADHNVTIENGAAVLWAKHEKHGYYDYTSFWIETHGKREFKYGYFEVRMKAMFGNGPWASFLMLGSNYRMESCPKCGEIELYDQRTGTRNNTYPGDSAFDVSCDFASASGGPLYNTSRYFYTDCLCNDYHLYAVEWDSIAIKYFFDGNRIWEYDSINESYNFSSFHQPFFFDTRVFLNAPLDTGIFPQKMYIDYVRVYQKSTHVNAIPPKNMPENMTLGNPSKTQLKVYDLQGRLMRDLTDLPKHINFEKSNFTKAMLSNLPMGAYAARYDNGSNKYFQKIIVTK